MAHKKGTCFYCKRKDSKMFCSKRGLEVDNSMNCPDFLADRSKVGKGSKKKGSKFELDIAKAYTKALGIPFGRVPASGGLRWKKRSDVIGDITCQDEDVKLKFVVECKNQEDWSLRDLLFNGGKLRKFIEQSMDEGQRANKVFHLVAKSKGYKPIFISNDNQFSKVENNTITQELWVKCEEYPYAKHINLYIMDFEIAVKHMKFRKELKPNWLFEVRKETK